MKANEYHLPVLLSQCIEALKIKDDDVLVDATFGAGGHSAHILKALGGSGKLYAFDQDSDALKNALPDKNFTLFHSNYRFIDKFLRLERISRVDGILADLGISSHQIDVPERGFSFRYDARLDMRMNNDAVVDAEFVVNEYIEEDLVALLSAYGEVRNAKTLAAELVRARKAGRIETTFDLNRVLDRVRMGAEAKYFAQVYQALRIEVNDEMNALKEFLTLGGQLLKPGGRFVVLSYHSLEDRLVKNLFKTGNVDGKLVKDEYGSIERPFKMVNKQVIVADAKEQRENPRSRSAKLRIAERI